jgi:hypothetical protein
MLKTDPDPDPIRIQSGSGVFMTKNWKKFTAKKNTTNFWINGYRYLSLGLHKGRPSYKRNLQLSKGNILHFKSGNFKKYPTFGRHFCSPESKYGFGFTDLIESGSDPDPKPLVITCEPYVAGVECACTVTRWWGRRWRGARALSSTSRRAGSLCACPAAPALQSPTISIRGRDQRTLCLQYRLVFKYYLHVFRKKSVPWSSCSGQYSVRKLDTMCFSC